MANVIERVGAGTITRLLVMMPPRSGKSELVSRLLPGWWLMRDPDAHVGLASYGANLAHDLSREAREYYEQAGGVVDASAAAQWRVQGGVGRCWAVGVGGPATGKGLTLGIVDDPHKDRLEADSELQRRRVHDWWRAVWSTRLHPHAVLVVVSTRWHEDDLVGWLLRQEKELEPETRQDWHIVLYDQLFEPETREKLPETCTLEPDWREPGDPLCPERMSLGRILKVRAQSGAREWGALHQQSPSPPGGDVMKKEWFRWVDKPPLETRKVRAWDLAGTQDGGDWTAGVLIEEADGHFYVTDVVRGQWSAGNRDSEMKATAMADGPGVVQVIEQEGGTHGADRVRQIVVSMAGVPVETVRPLGSKPYRAEAFASQLEVSNVSCVKGKPWVSEYLDELAAFPLGKHDDQVDATAYAFNQLVSRHVISMADMLEGLREREAQRWLCSGVREAPEPTSLGATGPGLRERVASEGANRRIGPT